MKINFDLAGHPDCSHFHNKRSVLKTSFAAMCFVGNIVYYSVKRAQNCLLLNEKSQITAKYVYYSECLKLLLTLYCIQNG